MFIPPSEFDPYSWKASCAVTSTPTPIVTPTPLPTVSYNVYITFLDLQSEYVKIENSGASDVDMTNWLLRDESDNRFYFTNFILKSGKTVSVVTDYGNNTESRLYWNRGCCVWNDQGDTAFLYDANNNLVSQYPRT